MRSQLKKYTEILKNVDLLKLWVAHTISTFGDWLIFVVLIQRIFKLSHSSFAVGSLMIFKVLPALTLGSFAGVAIDKFDRKKIMIVCDILRGLIVIALPLFHILPPIYLFVFLLECLSLLFLPAREASIPNIVSQDQIMISNSLFYLTNNITMFLSLTFGSTIVFIIERTFNKAPALRAIAGQNLVFYIDSFTFFISAVLTAITLIPDGKKEKIKSKVSIIFKEAAGGWKYLKGNALVRTMLVSIAIQIFGAGSVAAVGAAYCEYALGVGSESIGFLMSSFGFGLIVGSIIVGVIESYLKKSYLFSLSIFITGICLILFSVTSSIQYALILGFISGLTSAMSILVLVTSLQSFTENEIRGRILIILESTFRVSLLLSLVVSGILSDVLGKGMVRFFGHQLPFQSTQFILLGGGVIGVLASIFAFKQFKILKVEI